MATRAEMTRAEQARKGPSPRTIQRALARRTKAERMADAPATPGHAARKATYAREEPPASGPPSRKSTRAAAHHARNDTNLALREQRAQTSPEARARRAAVERGRVRGPLTGR